MSDSKLFTYEVLAEDPGTHARAGVFHTAHGDIHTPVFMPVGTKGTVKGLLPDTVASLGAQIVLNNTKIDSIFVNATENGATYANGGIKLVVNGGSEVKELHTNIGITRTFHEVNGGTVGSVLADVE